MKKLLRKITGWLIKKTDYELALPVQTIYIKPQGFKQFHCQHLVNWNEYQYNPLPKDWYVCKFKEEVMESLSSEIEIKTEETPDGVCYSCDLLFKNI